MLRRAKRAAAAAAVLGALGSVAAGTQGCGGSTGRDRGTPTAPRQSSSAAIPAGAQPIRVEQRPFGRPVPAGFLGLSLELNAVQPYVGSDPALFDQLIRNLDPGQAPVLRIGGDTADRAWWPVAGLARPPGVRIDLGPRWLAAVRRLADGLGARLILGLNLEADSGPLAAAEARAFQRGLGRRIEALELGNEPDLYSSFPWYRRAAGNAVTGRPAGYDFRAFTRDFVGVAGALPHVPLAGPALGTPPWTRDLGTLLSVEPRISLLTLHRYPLQRCFTTPSSPRYPSISHLLSPRASRGLASALVPAVRAAHQRGIGVRLDEINSVACRGSEGVSDTFASALWALEVSLDLARVGLDGVNFHTFPGAGYQLFSLAGTGAARNALVYPEYYGLMMFAQAAPPRSRLLRTAGPRDVGVWATRDQTGTIRVVLVNDSAWHGRAVALRVPPGGNSARLERLRAWGLRATTGVSLGGRSFGAQTSTGILAGRVEDPLVHRVHGRFDLWLPAASATLLTLTGPGVGVSVGDAAALSPGGQLQQHR